MPKQETILQVFVASPSDLSQERDALEDVIRELTSTWSRALGFRLELVRWETHAVPGMGIDAQDVANRSVPQDYDIFVGMLWSHFGTPTNRAESGTEEEFRAAAERHAADPSSVRIMFYFKDAPLPPSEIDPEQLGKIQKFRASLSARGLYFTFNSIEEFQNLVRVHLSRVVQEFLLSPTRTAFAIAAPSGGSQAIRTTQQLPEVDEEEGVLDLLDEATEAMLRLNALVEQMAAATGELGGRMDRHTNEANELRDRGSYSIKEAKKIMSEAASDLTEYAIRTEAAIPTFAEALSTAMRSFSRAVSISIEFSTPDASGLRTVLDSSSAMRSTMAEAGNSLRGLRQAIGSTPRFTVELNKAKRRAVAVVDALLREFEVGDTHVAALQHSLEQIIGRANGEAPQ